MPYHGDGVANGTEADANAAAAILAAGIDYRTRRGWAVIPVPLGGKNPGRTGWQRLEIGPEALPDYFGAVPQNIGVRLGTPSGNVVDLDLDSAEALRLAPYLLPATDCCFGRLSKPRSHHFYQVVGDLSTKKFTDPLTPKGPSAMLLEVRSTGVQTLVPPSIHPSGESIAWEQDGEPTVAAALDLLAAASQLAAAALLARYWPGKGARNTAALALAGGLVRAGWAEADVERFVAAVAWAAGDEEAGDRGDAAPYTARAIAVDRPTTGWPTLARLIDPRVVDRFREWLGLRIQARSADAISALSPANASNPSCRRPNEVALPPATPFPIEVFPPVLASFVHGHGVAISVPVDMVAVPTLAFAAATIGRTCRIRIKAGYEQRPIFWGAIVGRPGTAKSPALSAAQWLVRQLQTEAAERYKREMAAYLRATDGDNNDDDAASDGERPRRPVLEHFYTTDTTKEALAVMAEDSPGFAIVRDELTAWVASFDAYRSGRGGDRQDFLTLWAGAALKIDRKKEEPIHVPEPTISVIGGIQPDLLGQLQNDAGNDGFLDRILFSFPETAPGPWSFAEVSDAAQQAALACFRHLRRSNAEAHVITFSAEAAARWQSWYDQNQILIATAPPALAGVYNKLPNQCARLALVLHCLWDPQRTSATLSGERLEGAIALTEYFRAHAQRVLALLGTSAAPVITGLPGRILRLLEAESDWINRTQLYRRLGNAIKADALTAALEALETLGRVERRRTATARRSAEQWRLMPSVPARMNEA